MLNVFRYNKANAQGQQRWAFRFSINNPARKHGKPGRANSLGYAFCAGRYYIEMGAIREHEMFEPFYSEDEAALECDCWKFWLMRFKGAQRIPYSLGTYDKVDSEHRLKYGKSIEEMEPSLALRKFLKDDRNQEMLQQLEAYAPSGAWNPTVELYEARKRLQAYRESDGEKTPGDWMRLELIKDWAVRYDEHMKSVAQVEDYGGAAKLKAEIDMHVQTLTNTLRYSENWEHPTEKSHIYFYPTLKALDEARAQLVKTLAEMKKIQAAVHAFADGLQTKTDALKDERIKI